MLGQSLIWKHPKRKDDNYSKARLEQLSLHLSPITPASSSSSIIPQQDFMNTSLDQNISENIEAITKAIGIPEFNRIELLKIVLKGNYNFPISKGSGASSAAKYLIPI